jgi:hypothetical protein
MVPRPKVIPRAKARKVTEMLLVMIMLEAIGLMARMESNQTFPSSTCWISREGTIRGTKLASVRVATKP